MGQQILMIKDNLNNQDRIEIPFNESDGVYLIVLNTNNSKKSTKILKY
jgi:nitrate reductase NapAB chaperone NapD